MKKGKKLGREDSLSPAGAPGALTVTDGQPYDGGMQAFAEITVHRPGLLVTGTDTGVGKTLVSCALAALLRRQMPASSLAVIKPFGSGCERQGPTLVHPDARLLARYARFDAPAEVVCPLRFEAPLAPAVAAEVAGVPMDWSALARALADVQQRGQCVLMEGVGGVCVPLDPAQPQITVLELAAWLGWPVLVVARAGLGTLNHTTLTLRLLAARGVPVAGVVFNAVDTAGSAVDPAIPHNARWIERMTGHRVLAHVPWIPPAVQAQADTAGEPAAAVAEALTGVDWAALCRPPVV